MMDDYDTGVYGMSDNIKMAVVWPYVVFIGIIIVIGEIEAGNDDSGRPS